MSITEIPAEVTVEAGSLATRHLTGDEYVESLRDDREIYIYGDRAKDVTEHPAFYSPIRMTARPYYSLHEVGGASGIAVPTTRRNCWPARWRSPIPLMGEWGNSTASAVLRYRGSSNSGTQRAQRGIRLSATAAPLECH
jgi:hypothetical protein